MRRLSLRGVVQVRLCGHGLDLLISNGNSSNCNCNVPDLLRIAAHTEERNYLLRSSHKRGEKQEKPGHVAASWPQLAVSLGSFAAAKTARRMQRYQVVRPPPMMLRSLLGPGVKVASCRMLLRIFFNFFRISG